MSLEKEYKLNIQIGYYNNRPVYIYIISKYLVNIFYICRSVLYTFTNKLEASIFIHEPFLFQMLSIDRPLFPEVF